MDEVEREGWRVCVDGWRGWRVMLDGLAVSGAEYIDEAMVGREWIAAERQKMGTKQFWDMKKARRDERRVGLGIEENVCLFVRTVNGSWIEVLIQRREDGALEAM